MQRPAERLPAAAQIAAVAAGKYPVWAQLVVAEAEAELERAVAEAAECVGRRSSALLRVSLPHGRRPQSPPRRRLPGVLVHACAFAAAASVVVRGYNSKLHQC